MAPHVTSPPKRPRHLMDPDHPQRMVNDQALTRVQRWVMSVLAFVTIFHLAAGLALVTVLIDDRYLAARIGLNMIAGVCGMVAVGAALMIHKRPLASPWLLVGLVPGVVGLLVNFL